MAAEEEYGLEEEEQFWQMELTNLARGRQPQPGFFAVSAPDEQNRMWADRLDVGSSLFRQYLEGVEVSVLRHFGPGRWVRRVSVLLAGPWRCETADLPAGRFR